MSKYTKLTHQVDDELLSWLSSAPRKSHRQADWLLSDFSEPIWNVVLSKKKSIIDWHVRLDDGSLLTASKNQTLLEIFKCWLCIQGHTDFTGGSILSKETISRRISRVARLIDYFLIRANYFQLGRHGLSLVTASDIRTLYITLASSNETDYSIYEADTRLRNYLMEKSAALTNEQIKIAIDNQPLITKLTTPPYDRILFPEDNDLIRVRCYLQVAGHYGRVNDREFRQFSLFLDLLRDIYPDAIWSTRSIKLRPEELWLSPYDYYFREYAGVPVAVNDNEQMSWQTLTYWDQVIRSLAILADMKLPVPIDALSESSNLGHIKSLGLASPSRFRTIPTTWCIGALRKSIEFTLSYGDDLLQSYLNVALAAYRSKTTLMEFIKHHDIDLFLTSKLRQIGVKFWDVGSTTGVIRPPLSQKADYAAKSLDRYFDQVRANEGLFELIRILFGSIQYCVGLLSARRVSELLALAPGSALDKSRRYLIFYNMKSGFDGIRDKNARPIPPIVERMIGMLEHFQRELCKWGLLKSPQALFAQPGRFTNDFTHSTHAYVAALDLFCDYFSAPLDQAGRRYYIRPHQLRRAFAMFFFWHRSYAGLGTLTWFFGHSDPEQIYRYVTESTPGETLSWVKATYGAQLILDDPSAYEDFSQLIEQHFGTKNFSVLDLDELEHYIHELIEDQTVTIEPHFFTTSDGRDYQVITHVRKKKQ